MDQNIYKLVYKVTHAGGSGSCFYLKSYNLFVTNYHVVNGFHTVAIHDNDRNPYLAKVVLVNPSLDIALLAVDADFSALPELSLAADDSLAIGGKVSVAGYPYGMPFTVTEGSVSSPKQLMEGKYYIQTDAAVNPGNSGGPIFNENSEVVGVTATVMNKCCFSCSGNRKKRLCLIPVPTIAMRLLASLSRTGFSWLPPVYP